MGAPAVWRRKLLHPWERSSRQGSRTRHGYEADLWHMAVMMKSEQGALTAAADGNTQYTPSSDI
jgi:hypothetical protein